MCSEDKYHTVFLMNAFLLPSFNYNNAVFTSYSTLNYPTDWLGGQASASAVTLFLLLTYGFGFLTRT